MQTSDQPCETKPAEINASQEAQSQEELHRLYLEQQQRLSCPGCGEGQQSHGGYPPLDFKSTLLALDLGSDCVGTT